MAVRQVEIADGKRFDYLEIPDGATFYSLVSCCADRRAAGQFHHHPRDNFVSCGQVPKVTRSLNDASICAIGKSLSGVKSVMGLLWVEIFVSWMASERRYIVYPRVSDVKLLECLVVWPFEVLQGLMKHPMS